MRLFKRRRRRSRFRQFLEAEDERRHKHLPAAARIIFGLLIFIFVGTAILLLPGIATAGRLSLQDAFFTAASALTVTGLATIDASVDLTLLGQIVLLFFIQIGGVGYMFIAVILMRLIGRQVFILDRLALANSLGLDTPAAILEILRQVLQGILAVEATGAILLFVHWRTNDIVPADRTFFYAIFHAISAFCNAGFDLFNGSPLFPNGVPNDSVTLLILAAIIILGGLGIPVLSELFTRKAGRGRFSLHTQLTLTIVVGLLLVGWLGHLFPELGPNGVLNGMTLDRQLVISFFQSASNRTAGFAGLPDFTNITPASQLLTIVLMFIGSAPASMGGGITTGTFLVIVLTLRGYARGDAITSVWQRTISQNTVRRAGAVLTVSLLVTLLATFLILLTHDAPLNVALFEVVSAFATCGLSLGLTRDLNLFGQIVIVVMMIWGRLGALTIVIALAQRQRVALLHYPEETILIG